MFNPWFLIFWLCNVVGDYFLQFSLVCCSWHTYSSITCVVFRLLGILDAAYMKAILVDGFLAKMTSGELDLWKVKYGKSVNESLRQFAIEYVGEPIQRALRWDNKITTFGLWTASHVADDILNGMHSLLVNSPNWLLKTKNYYQFTLKLLDVTRRRNCFRQAILVFVWYPEPIVAQYRFPPPSRVRSTFLERGLLSRAAAVNQA